MLIKNTTDIPDMLVEMAVKNGIQPGVEVDTVFVKNKRKGKVAGQWGWYFKKHRKYGRMAVVIVPRKIHAPLPHPRRYAGLTMIINSRVEMLAAVMGHELRHAYQYQILGWHDASKAQKETDAEQWEVVCLHSWRKMINSKIGA